jgi:hypothetical protein
MTTAGLAAVVLAALVYLPAGWALSNLASPIAFDHDADPFRRLDVVLVNRWAFAWRRPKPGDVVLFRPVIELRAVSDYTAAHMRILISENVLIDRVLGGPGDRVVWNGRKLDVNGNSVSWTPLIGQKLPKHLDITVPADRYLVLPTTSRAVLHGGDSLYWKTVGLISAADIEGGAFLRNSPASRFWFIR